MILKELYQINKAKLREFNVDVPDLEARMILEHVLNITREDLVLRADLKITDDQVSRITDIIQMRGTGKPLAKILETKDFWGLTFKTNVHTLDPRPDSETVIEAVLKYMPDVNRPLEILDIGTGTGCLIISLLSEYKNAKGWACDISPDALTVAEENRASHNMQDRLTLMKCGWNDLPMDKVYDVIISNPPYIAEHEKETLDAHVVDYDPAVSLFSGVDGMDSYREISKIISKILKPETGRAVFEFGHTQADDVSDIFVQNAMQVLQVCRDLGGRDRCVVLKTL